MDDVQAFFKWYALTVHLWSFVDFDPTSQRSEQYWRDPRGRRQS